MTRVDFVVPGNIETLTGGYIYDRRIVDGLIKRGWRTTVRSLDTSFPTPTPAALDEARAVFAAIPDGRIVVIDGLALGGSADILRSEAARLRLCALVHHPLALETGLDALEASSLRRAERASLAAVRRVIVTSPWTRRALAGYGVDAGRITVVEPGTDPAPARRASDRRTLRLLCVASLTARKGHAILFDALAQLADRDWHLVCAGSLSMDAALAEALNQQIERLGLGARISVIGELAPDALAEHYEDCDVFVLASYMEGYGMVLAEAMARGIPVISTTAGAIPDTVAAEATVLVPPGDSHALAQALRGVMDDRATLTRLIDAARTARTKLPDWDQACARFADALEKLMQP